MATHRRRSSPSPSRAGAGETLAVDVGVGPEIKRVADELRAIDKKLPTKFRAQMRKTAAAGVRRAKTEARSMPVAGVRGGTRSAPHKPKQLRRMVARGVRVRASSGGRYGVGLRIVTSMPLPSQAMLPRGLDSSDPGHPSRKGWRHPLFGDTETWVDQPGGSWFRAPIAEEHGPMGKALMDLLEAAAAQVAAAGVGPGAD